MLGLLGEALQWEQQDEIPYTIALVVHLLQGEQKIPNDNNSLDILVEGVFATCSTLEESSNFAKT